MGSNKDKQEKKGFFKKIIDDVSENIKEGASFLGSKAAEAGEKVAETSAKAYVASSEFVSETSDKIHDYTEKQTLQKKEAKLEKRQVELSNKFGKITLKHYLKNDSLHKPFLTSKVVVEVIEEYKANEKEIKSIKRKIKQLENH
ncbi:MAG: hypothetical protein CSA39_01660 [Flavobacteriales bacterium]|nr:MAG: hypothetical protein CSA39_01660 [Flavobacteriales bacterium]